MMPFHALPSVELVIPREQFFDAMRDIGTWLRTKQIASPYCTSREDGTGDRQLRFAFHRAREAANFARRFDGRLAGTDAR